MCCVFYEDSWACYFMFFDMIYLLTAIGLSPGGSAHLHTNNTQNNTNNNWTTQIQANVEEWGPCPVFASFTLAFALQLRKKHRKTSVRVRKTSVRIRETSVRVQYTYYQNTHPHTHTHTPIPTHTHTHTHTHTLSLFLFLNHTQNNRKVTLEGQNCHRIKYAALHYFLNNKESPLAVTNRLLLLFNNHRFIKGMTGSTFEGVNLLSHVKNKQMPHQ